MQAVSRGNLMETSTWNLTINAFGPEVGDSLWNKFSAWREFQGGWNIGLCLPRASHTGTLYKTSKEEDYAMFERDFLHSLVATEPNWA
jgi:hypothetical protein